MDESIKLALEEKDDIYDRVIKENINDRKIVINCDINDDLLENVILYILLWNKQDKDIPVEKRKKIFLYINSDGGDLILGNAILDVIINSKTPVVTVGFAKCASMASYILAAGHERICFPSTVVLIHDGQTGYMSSGNKGKDIQKFYDSLDQRVMDFMIQYTTMTKEYLESIKDRETYLFAEEAKEKGIVDKVIGVDCDLDYIL
ncbi:MAG: ATP-dependent Clp protease proteolytic subunit [Clostridium sp.]|nr:ATP-dependent Clp protease proteolytic subunit [Clostridium sp.]